MSGAQTYGFIEPDRALDTVPFSDLHTILDIPIMSGHRADLAPFAATDPGFAALLSNIKVDADYEDQCSAKYYHDIYNVVMSEAEKIDRIVEVGIFMGGSSVIFGGCLGRIDADLVMIDIGEKYLQFGYQRVVRNFPDIASRVRLFHGDLPTYTRDVLLTESSSDRLMVHVDGDHSFQGVLRDVGVLSYVKERVVGIMAQDTHLRGPPKGMRFVDLALLAAFGGDMAFVPLGSAYEAWQTELVNPNKFAGGYFLPGKLEGMYLPMSHNTYEYPHPLIPIDQFFW